MVRFHFAALAAAVAVLGENSFQQTCLSFTPEQYVFNATRLELQYVVAGTNITFPNNPASFQRPAQWVEADICRIAMIVPTSNRSSVTLELWLPSTWTGRVLAAGNGGLDGCK